MSREAANNFLRELRDSSSLQQEAQTAAEDREGRPFLAVTELAAMAKRHGYDVSSEEVMNAVIASASVGGDRELSDSELARVSGGVIEIKNKIDLTLLGGSSLTVFDPTKL